MNNKKLKDKEDLTQEELELYESGFAIDEDGKEVRINTNYFSKYVKDNYHLVYAYNKCFYEYNKGVWT